MQVKVTKPSENEAIVAVIASESELDSIKQQVVLKFQANAKVPGFRPGKVPAEILEKQIDPNALQSEFLESAIEQIYVQAINGQKLRPVGRPEINVKKFVPFTTLEFEATLPIIGEIKLADYKKIKKVKPEVKITQKDIDEVLQSLATRMSVKKDVDRAAKDGDQVYIDFKGQDKDGKPVNGAEGTNYPLILGSKTFIPGFEENLIGLKTSDEKVFTLTFPKDYGIKTLANKKVTFSVTVTKVQSVEEPALDDDFASKVGPFKTLDELKKDINTQLTAERQREADAAFQNELIQEISNKSSLSVPDILVNDQIEKMEQEEKQNLAYRGQTWQEHLDEEGKTEQQHKDENRPKAIERLKASLVMAEIAEQEKLDVTADELDVRMQLLKAQYQDPQMQIELEKPEARRDIAGRILTEKTLELLQNYATQT